MADENKVKITLQTVADGKGVEETKKGQDEVISKTKEQTAATKEATAATKEQTAAEDTQAAKRGIGGSGSTNPFYSGPGMPGLNAPGGAAPHVETINTATKATKALEEATEELTEAEKEQLRIEQERDRLLERKAKGMEDVAKASQRKRQREEIEQSESGLNTPLATGNASAAMRAGGVAAIAGTASVALGAVKDTLLQFRELRKEISGGTEDLEPFHAAVLETIEVIENPLGAIKEALIWVTGAKESLEDLKKGADEARKMREALAEAVAKKKELEETAANNAFDTAMARRRREIDGMTASLQRQIDLLNSERDLTEVKASRADREAIAKGADPNVVASGAIARGARAQIDQQGDEEAKAEVARDVAAEKAQIATEALRKAKREGETAEKLQQLWVEMEAADDAVKQAQQDLENAQKIAANRAEQIIDQAQERIESESEENSRRVTDVVEGIRDKLRAEADKVVEEGGKVSGEFERQMGIIKTLLEDKVADNKQTYELYHAITSAIAESTKLQKDFLKDITVERAKIAELRTAYENIQAIQKDLGR